MKSSESIVNLAKAIYKFQSNLTNIGKDATNPFLKNKYATLTNILDAINPLLCDAGLVIMQPPGTEGDMITLTTILIHAETGEYMESNYSMTPAKKDAQTIGSCITYMRRYAITSILKLNVDDDDDGNQASNVRSRMDKARLSDVAQNLKDRMELAETMGELKSLAEEVKNSQVNTSEKEVLLECYKQSTARIKALAK